MCRVDGVDFESIDTDRLIGRYGDAAVFSAKNIGVTSTHFADY